MCLGTTYLLVSFALFVIARFSPYEWHNQLGVVDYLPGSKKEKNVVAIAADRYKAKKRARRFSESGLKSQKIDEFEREKSALGGMNENLQLPSQKVNVQMQRVVVNQFNLLNCMRKNMIIVLLESGSERNYSAMREVECRQMNLYYSHVVHNWKPHAARMRH